MLTGTPGRPVRRLWLASFGLSRVASVRARRQAPGGPLTVVRLICAWPRRAACLSAFLHRLPAPGSWRAAHSAACPHKQSSLYELLSRCSKFDYLFGVSRGEKGLGSLFFDPIDIFVFLCSGGWVSCFVQVAHVIKRASHFVGCHESHCFSMFEVRPSLCCTKTYLPK